MATYTNTPFSDLIPPPTEIDNEHKVYSIGIAIIILGIVSSLFVFARLAQRYMSRNLGLDDYAIVVAELTYLAWTAMAAYMALNTGIGKPIGDVTYGEFTLFYQGIFIASWMYPIMSAAIRVSVLLFYRRIFGKGSTVYTVVIWTLLALQGGYIVTFVVMPGFYCTPISDGWDPIARLTACSDLYIYGTEALYSVSLAFDIILLVFPVFAVSRLQMPVKKRVGVAIIFMLGACAGIVAAYKLGIFVYQSNNWEPTDPTWWNYQASEYMPPQFETYGTMFWIPTQLEPTVALIGTSLPAMLQVYSAASVQFSRLVSTLSSATRRSGGSGDNSTRGIDSRPSLGNLRFRQSASAGGKSSGNSSGGGHSVVGGMGGKEDIIMLGGAGVGGGGGGKYHEISESDMELRQFASQRGSKEEEPVVSQV